MAYTSSQAQAGRGTVVSIGPVVGTATPTYTQINECKTASITGNKWNTVDVTNFNSGNAEEFLTTIIASGTIPLAGNRVSSDPGQTALFAANGTGKLYLFEIELPLTATQTTKGDTFSFNALVESVDFTVDVEKPVEFSATLKISGPVAEVAGS